MTDNDTDDFPELDSALVERITSIDETEAAQRANALRQGLSDYDLDDEDLGILDAATEDVDAITYLPALPVLAIVGRPNFGKSALVNRIIGRRGVVEDTPVSPATASTTRAVGPAQVHHRRHRRLGARREGHQRLGRRPGRDRDRPRRRCALRRGCHGRSHRHRRARRAHAACHQEAVILVANKVDDVHQEPDAAALWSLGLGEPWPVSAVHGRGVADLLDHVMTVLPEISTVAKEEVGGPRRVAILGRPNVGKSSLLNKTAGEERVVVNELAGTTRDPVDEQIELGGKFWRFVDTAGIRRRVNLAQGADFYATLRTSAALEKAEVAVVVLDVTEPISVQDLKIIDLVLESGRALVLAYNKWDLLDDERRIYLEKEIERDLSHVTWAPRVNISAKTGRHLEKLVPALELALASWDTRIPTGKFNALLAELTAEHPHPVRGGKQPRILFGTQAASRPPTFVLFTTGFLDPQYRRFITRRLREIFGFEGSPINVNMRVREKRKR